MKANKKVNSILVYVDKELYKKYKELIKKQGLLLQPAVNILIEKAIIEYMDDYSMDDFYK